MNKKKSILRAAGFIIIFSILLGLYFRIITPKYYTSQIYSTTTTYKGFYELEKDSLDVIFLGSSHGSTGFIPQEIYDGYGIRSYNLSCEMQNLSTSYYWLKEALKTQHPRAVIIESAMLVTKLSDDDETEDYYCTKKALDAMRPGIIKLQAAKEMSDYFDKNLTEFLLPNVSYHDRWSELESKDIEFSRWEKYTEMRGYTVIPIRSGEEFEGYDFSSSEPDEKPGKIADENRKRMDRIATLCKDEGIELILAINPAMSIKKKQAVAAAEYAEENGLTLLNFDDSRVLKEMNYNYEIMSSDGGHLNILGAEKVSDYIGRYLAENLGISPQNDEVLNKTSDYYDYLKKRCSLMYIEDAGEYISLIEDDRFLVTEKDKAAAEEDGTLVYDGVDYSLNGIGKNILVRDAREGTVVDCVLIEGDKVSHSEMVELMLQ